MGLTNEQVKFLAGMTKLIIEQRGTKEINKEVINCLELLVQLINSNEPSIWKLVILRVIHGNILEMTESMAEQVLIERDML